MLRKMHLYLFVLFAPLACASNVEVVAYNINDKVGTVKSKSVMKEFKSLFASIDPNEMNYILSAPDILKIVVQTRFFEDKMVLEEALVLSNYQEDEKYLDNLSYQSNALVLDLAFQKGLSNLSNKLQKLPVAIAEVSRIMFTNDTLVDGKTPAELLNDLQFSEGDVAVEFTLAAEKYSHEQLGVQTGGYLGQILKGQFPALDESVFEEEAAQGIYPKLISDQYGTYLLYVHTPVKKIKVANFEKENIIVTPEQLQANYLNQNVEYLFSINDNGILLNGVQKTYEELQGDDVLVKLWGKPYNLAHISSNVRVLMEGSTPIPLNTAQILSFISPTRGKNVPLAMQQLAIIENGYDKNIKSSKEYKKQIKTNLQSLKIQTAYNIVSADLYKTFNTNVTEKELKELYADENNRQIVSYNDDGTPKYASFLESKEILTRTIVAQRANVIRQEFQQKLDKKYQIIWNEENLLSVLQDIQEEYEKYLSKSIEEQGMDDEFISEEVVEEITEEVIAE